MSNIIFNTELIKGAKGDTGETGLSYEVPTGAVIAYDGAGVPEGYIETTEPLPPVPSGGDLPFNLTEIIKGTSTSTSRQTYTQTLTEAGFYVCLFTASRADENSITYNGTYTLIHTLKGSTHSMVDRFPCSQIDIIEVTGETVVTMSFISDRTSGYAILKIDDITTVGAALLSVSHAANATAYTDDLTQVTAATEYILVAALGSDTYSTFANYRFNFAAGEVLTNFNPLFTQIGERAYTAGGVMVVKKEAITAIITELQNTGVILAFACELSD